MSIIILSGGLPPTVYEPEPDWSNVQVTEPYSEPAPAHWKEGDLMDFTLTYIQGAELPTGRILWNDWNDEPINFSEGWTFLATVGHLGSEPVFTKSAGIAGGDGFIDVQWDPQVEQDLNLLAPGRYDMQIRARRDSDGRDRKRQGSVIIEPSLGMGVDPGA